MMKMFYCLCFALFSATAKSQIGTFTNHITGTATTTDATSYSIGSTSYVASTLYIAMIWVSGANNDGELVGTGLNWVKIGSVGDATKRIVVFRTVPITSTTTANTFQSFGSTGTGSHIRIWSNNNRVFNRNGATAVEQVATASGTSTTPTVDFPAAMSSTINYVLALFMNEQNPFTGTVEAGWTESGDVGYTTPDMGLYYMRRGTTSDDTPSTTITSGSWIGIAIEFTTPRRIIPIQ